MLLLIAVAALLALGLQLRARPAPAARGYYLGADGVICMTSWKVVDRPAPAKARSGPAAAQPLALSAGPWGAAQPAAADPAPAAMPLPAPAPMRFSAEDLAACLNPASKRAADVIVIPADVLAEIDAAEPPAGPHPSERQAAWDERLFEAALQPLHRTGAHSITLH